MPRRPSIHFGTSTSPHHSSSTVNDVAAHLSRKITASHIESAFTATPSSRRPSFSMDNILHPHRDKNRSDSKDRDAKKEKRKSLSLRAGNRPRDHSSQNSPRLAPVRPGKFEVIIESPPLVCHGNVNQSTGALLGGQVKLIVEDPSGQVTLQKFTMGIRAVIKVKKPVTKDCPDCKERIEELKSWDVLTEPKTFKKEEDNHFPLSYLFQGHLAASTLAELGSIKYELVANALTSDDEVIDLVHPLTLQRALPEPSNPKTSIRIFPPTHLTARISSPSVVHPIGKFPIQMVLSGLVERKGDNQTRWRLRKLLWRIEENCSMVSVPCKKHIAKVADGKALQNDDTKLVGNSELKSGWKTDFDTAGGEIVFDFEAALSTKITHKPVCDVDSPVGLEVKHNLVIELIVAEEFTPGKNSSLITPTGAARVLRMQFALVVTERSGMGISWDEEMPPMYDDVPDSPPGYGIADKNTGAFGGAMMEEYEGPPLPYEELERVHTENPNDQPVYRERDVAQTSPSLPIRSENTAAPSSSTTVVDVGGPSATRARPLGLTEDELFAEPPRYSLRRREDSETSQAEVEPDVGVGEAQ